MKTKIIITLIALSLCPALYAMPKKDNTLQELKKEISDTVKEEIPNYDFCPADVEILDRIMQEFNR